MCSKNIIPLGDNAKNRQYEKFAHIYSLLKNLIRVSK